MAFAEMLGLSSPDIDTTTAREQMTEDEEEFRSNIREEISRALADPMGENEPLIQALEQRARKRISQQRDRAQEEASSQLEKRGIQDSGIAADTMQDIERQGLQQQSESQNQLQQLISQRDMQNLQQAQSLSGQDVNLASNIAQSKNRASLREQKMQSDRMSSLIGGLGGAIVGGPIGAQAGKAMFGE